VGEDYFNYNCALMKYFDHSLGKIYFETVSNFETVSIYRQNSFEFQNDFFRKYLFRNYDNFSIKTQIFVIFNMFEIFDTICMCLNHTKQLLSIVFKRTIGIT
jgi:hypothetical protein